MNREIEFRGQKCSDGKWVYGFYVESKTSWRGHKPHKSWIVPNAISNGGFFNVLGRYAVKDDTVGQFTGLRDKNGVKIFEGDILKAGNESAPLEVRFVRGVFAFLWNGDLDDEFPCNAPTHEWAEVVGNIYDNPELLNEK